MACNVRERRGHGSRRQRTLFTAALALALVGGTHAGLCSDPAKVVRPSASNPPGDIARGQAIAETCKTCHAAADMLAGTPPVHPPRLFHQRASAIFYALQDYRSGRRQSNVMQPMAASLDDQQVRDIASYLASKPLGPPVPQMAGTPDHAFAASHCGLCHGETGMGEMEGMPILTGQNKDYLTAALNDYKDGRRSDPTMRAVAHELSRAQIESVATYYSSQHALEMIP